MVSSSCHGLLIACFNCSGSANTGNYISFVFAYFNFLLALLLPPPGLVLLLSQPLISLLLLEGLPSKKERVRLQDGYYHE
jgi:hypothetical protein